jgi:FixJ family two-component response regulator
LKDSAEVDLVRAVQTVHHGGLSSGIDATVQIVLAEGNSNKEEATDLQISPYTVDSHRTT